MSIGLIFDATGSMQDKISRARDAAVSFLKTGNPEDEFFLLTFSPRLADGFTTDSTNEPKDGKWRKIRVKINPPKGLPTSQSIARAGITQKRWISNHKCWRKDENRT